MRKSFLLVLVIPLILVMASCASKGGPLFPADALLRVPGEAKEAAPSAEANRVAVVAFADERPTMRSRFNFPGVPVVEFLALFIPDKTTHPEWEVSPAPDAPMGAVAGMAFAGALMGEATDLVVEYLPHIAAGDVPASFDYVVSGRILWVVVRHVEPDYGLNFFTLLDLSVLPKLLGAPTRRLSGSVNFEVEVRERFSGRLIHLEQVEWDSGVYTEGYYGAPVGIVGRR